LNTNIHAVTGAFGYSGRYIAARLLAQGRTVVTLTNSANRANPFGDKVCAFPLAFDEPDKLAAALDGVEVLYNTY
jgi:NADH dehydrogenase